MFDGLLDSFVPDEAFLRSARDSSRTLGKLKLLVEELSKVVVALGAGMLLGRALEVPVVDITQGDDFDARVVESPIT